MVDFIQPRHEARSVNASSLLVQLDEVDILLCQKVRVEDGWASGLQTPTVVTSLPVPFECSCGFARTNNAMLGGSSY